MRVLVACEFSGVVREAFRARGHDAWSCDLLPAEDDSEFHIKGDAIDAINCGPKLAASAFPWDLMIAHPPCTYLNSAGLHWNGRWRGHEKTEAALAFVRALMAAPIARICIENPVGCIGTRIRPADQYIQPYEFGHDASKKTGLWLKNLPPLIPTKYVNPRWVGKKARWANQTDSGQNRLPPSANRWALRSITYQGIADAMAEQWGSLT